MPNRTAPLILALAAALANCGQALALSQTDDIDTNRPSFMDSPLVLPKSSVQLENGTLYQHFQHSTNYFDISETELRVGLTDKTEFQMFVPNFVLLRSPGDKFATLTGPPLDAVTISSTPAVTRTGVSDLNEIGFKHQFNPILKDMNIALIAGVSPPTGNKFISGPGVQPVIRTPFTKQISKNWSVGGMQSLLVINEGRDVQYQNFLDLMRAFGSRTSAFIEYGGFYTHHSAANNIFHSGIVRKINRNNQVDLQYGFGLDRTAPVAFIGAGYSFRFDHFPFK